MSSRSLSSLRVRLLLLVFFALIPAFGLVLFMAWEQRLGAAVSAKEKALMLTRDAVQQQRQIFSQARRLLGELAQRPEIHSTKPTICSAFLAAQLKQHPRYINFGVIESDGNLACSALPFKGPINAADRTYFQKTVKTHDFSIGDYQIGRATGKASINLGYPNFDSRGKFQGVIVAALDLGWLNGILTQASLPTGSVLTVIDQNGRILARSADAEKWVGKVLPQAPIVRAVLSQAREGTLESQGVDGVDRLYAFSPIVVSGSPAVYVAMGIAKDVAYASVSRTIIRNLMLLGLLTVLALVTAWFGADLLVLRTVSALVNATKRLAAGDLGVRTGLCRWRRNRIC